MTVYYIRNGLFLFIFLFIISSCQKNNKSNASNNPNVATNPVDIYIHMNTSEAFPLTIDGGWIYKAGGTKGIIIYRRSSTDFVALERNCPYDGVSNSKALVRVQSDNISIKDSICGSTFLMDGSVSAGPSKYPLTAYRTTFDGEKIHVFN